MAIKASRNLLCTLLQSYRGKFAATLGASVVRAIEAGELKVQLGGVALGNNWISPEDFVFSWGSFLRIFQEWTKLL
ncbi:hypothetical protein SLA2020_008830 [Shorea laevis]